VTETKTKEDLDEFLDVLQKAICGKI
jgi:glycine cleavage system protein P-like pyridoxal-binding family